MINKGSFIISLDFEMQWGMRDLPFAERYKRNILGVKFVIPKMVELFQKYDVKATFAVVGLLLCDSLEDIHRYSPSLKPGYTDKKLSPYENNYLETLSSKDDKYHTAYETIEYLKKQPNIEIGTHTFSHYYCWEEGQTQEEFEADLKAAMSISEEKGIQISSIIFPRNEVDEEYLRVCSKYGLSAYRGNPSKYFNRNGRFNRILRIIDTYINIHNDTTYSYSDIQRAYGVYNIKASRFLKPYSSKLSILDGLKIRRIKREMTFAAKNNRVYHLWWHPHNFGINQEQNLNMLEQILRHYSYLHDKYGMDSLSMNSVVNVIR